MKIKVLTARKAKKKAWESFSKYVRLRDCLMSSGTKDWAYCYTCGGMVFFKYGHAGHFIPGRTNDVLFDEKQVHLQCYICNIRKKGNWPAYYVKMIDEFGEEYVLKAIKDSQAKIIVKLSVPDYVGIYENYKLKYEELLKGGINHG